MKTGIVSGFICLFATAGSFCFAAESLPQRDRAGMAERKSRMPAPDFTLSDMNGVSFSLGSLRGRKPALILFWTTWCPYCRKAMKTLDERYGDLEAQGIEVLAVNVGEPAAKAAGFMKAHQSVYRVLLDESGGVAHSYGLMGVPTYVLVNKDGETVFHDNQLPYDRIKSLLEK